VGLQGLQGGRTLVWAHVEGVSAVWVNKGRYEAVDYMGVGRDRTELGSHLDIFKNLKCIIVVRVQLNHSALHLVFGL
jgi:hypothetical protein